MAQNQVYLIESPTRQGLAETFMRFQEYYESPEFAGRPFSVEEFTAWYIQKHRKFSYHRDWSGFNVPSSAFEPFFEGAFDPLTEKEKKMVDFFKKIRGNFYVIGITRSDRDWMETLKHELAHGLFFSDETYRNEVLSCIADLRPGPVRSTLKKMGYGSNVIDDEVNAYLLTEPETMAHPAKFSLSSGQKIQEVLDRIFQKHFSFSMIEAGEKPLIKNLNIVAI